MTRASCLSSSTFLWLVSESFNVWSAQNQLSWLVSQLLFSRGRPRRSFQQFFSPNYALTLYDDTAAAFSWFSRLHVTSWRWVFLVWEFWDESFLWMFPKYVASCNFKSCKLFLQEFPAYRNVSPVYQCFLNLISDQENKFEVFATLEVFQLRFYLRKTSLSAKV